MKTILSFVALGFCLLWQSGCASNAGVSVGHDNHRHGVEVASHAGNGSVGVGAGVQ